MTLLAAWPCWQPVDLVVLAARPLIKCEKNSPWLGDLPPETHDLSLIMSECQTNPNWRTFYKILDQCSSKLSSETRGVWGTDSQEQLGEAPWLSAMLGPEWDLGTGPFLMPVVELDKVSGYIAGSEQWGGFRVAGLGFGERKVTLC